MPDRDQGDDPDRDRSEGWLHAKLSGHKNEQLLLLRIQEEEAFARDLATRVGLDKITVSAVGGLDESSVPSVLGGVTKNKTDLGVGDGSRTVNVSIKKSEDGQVYLIGAERFLDGFEQHFSPVPPEVREGILLLFSGSDRIADLLASPELADSVSASVREYELRKKRLVWQSLEALDPKMAEATLLWFREHAGEIAAFCFGRGLARDEKHWADFVWYRNLVGEDDVAEFDELFDVDELARLCRRHAEKTVVPGTRNGGSTIQMPFGFLQWHQESMQFHHQLGDLRDLLALEAAMPPESPTLAPPTRVGHHPYPARLADFFAK